MERLFGTLKQKLDQPEIGGRKALIGLRDEFRNWCNHVRWHQNLERLTRAGTWSGVDSYGTAPKQAVWFEGRRGMDTGYYLRR